MSDLKVEGKVADFCPKCKNCKSTTRECDGEKDWSLMEVECEDPYDGMIKTLAADSDICCSMFTPKPFNLNMSREQLEEKILDLFDEKNRLNNIINKLEKEKAAHLKGIECLKKSNNDLKERYSELENNYNANAVETKRLKEANENLLEKCKVYIDEKADLKLKADNRLSNINFQKHLKDEAYKREDELKKELNKVKSHDEAITKHFQNDEKLIDNIQKVIFPQEEGSDYTYSYDEILNKVKDLKVQSDENGTMYEDLKYWKERCHNAETDVTTLNSKVEVLEKKFRKVDSIRDAIWNEKELNQKISDLTESNENLKKAVERRDRWVEDLKSDIDTLQNECLVIADIAKRAYDESIKIKEENENA